MRSVASGPVTNLRNTQTNNVASISLDSSVTSSGWRRESLLLILSGATTVLCNPQRYRYASLNDGDTF